MIQISLSKNENSFVGNIWELNLFNQCKKELLQSVLLYFLNCNSWLIRAGHSITKIFTDSTNTCID